MVSGTWTLGRAQHSTYSAGDDDDDDDCNDDYRDDTDDDLSDNKYWREGRRTGGENRRPQVGAIWKPLGNRFAPFRSCSDPYFGCEMICTHLSVLSFLFPDVTTTDIWKLLGNRFANSPSALVLDLQAYVCSSLTLIGEHAFIFLHEFEKRSTDLVSWLLELQGSLTRHNYSLATPHCSFCERKYGGKWKKGWIGFDLRRCAGHNTSQATGEAENLFRRWIIPQIWHPPTHPPFYFSAKLFRTL